MPLEHTREPEGALPEFEGFIRVVNGRFVDAQCLEFPVTGMNTWRLMEAAAGFPEALCTLPEQDPVQYTFTTAAANGMTVVRAFGHGVNDSFPLQKSPGVYNEKAFAALDYILDTAAYNGMKVLFTFGDNWQITDSKAMYNTWSGFPQSSDLFWTDPKPRQMYKDHIRAMVNRINSLNGIRYGDDPTIFAWNLMNEPRCDCFPASLPNPPILDGLPSGCFPACTNSITAWVGEMSAYLKSIDPNHLVTVGEEGFWGINDANKIYNPYNNITVWASMTGVNFTAQHNFDTIDFATVHYWPDLWTPQAPSDETFFTPWMQQHSKVAASIGKPLILEELGKAVVVNQTVEVLQNSVLTRREPFMKMVYGHFNESLHSDGNWRGLLFWMWGYCPHNTMQSYQQVSAGDADFKSVIAPASLSALIQASENSPIPNCVKVDYNLTANATGIYVHEGQQSTSSLPKLPSIDTLALVQPPPPPVLLAPPVTPPAASQSPPPPAQALQPATNPTNLPAFVPSGISLRTMIAGLQAAG